MKCSSPIRVRPTARSRSRASSAAGSSSASIGTSGDFKNWAIPQAAHEWVFILDADERITAELANEIRDTLDEPQHDGYWIYRLNHFMGHPIRLRAVAERPLPAAVPPRPGTIRRADRSCGSGTQQRHGGPAARSGSFITRALRTRSTCRSFRGTPMCRRGFGKRRAAGRNCGNCCSASRCDLFKATCCDSVSWMAWPGCKFARWLRISLG